MWGTRIQKIMAEISLEKVTCDQNLTSIFRCKIGTYRKFGLKKCVIVNDMIRSRVTKYCIGVNLYKYKPKGIEMYSKTSY